MMEAGGLFPSTISIALCYPRLLPKGSLHRVLLANPQAFHKRNNVFLPRPLKPDRRAFWRIVRLVLEVLEVFQKFYPTVCATDVRGHGLYRTFTSSDWVGSAPLILRLSPLSIISYLFPAFSPFSTSSFFPSPPCRLPHLDH